MVSQIVAAFCIGVLAQTTDVSGLKSDNQDRIKQMIAVLDSREDQLDGVVEVLGPLTRLAPSDTEAQNATVRYLERMASHGITVPISYARLLSQYDDHFGNAVMTSLTKSKTSDLQELWLVTFALMGKKASKQVEPLTLYLHQQNDPKNIMMARIALAKMGAAPTDNPKIIEKAIRERTAAGRAAVSMAALVGLREWANEKTVSEILHWLTAKEISEDDRCMAAMAIAVSGYRDKTLVRSLQTLLAKAMKDPDSSARICYAYALALMNPDQADRYWRVILKKLGPKQFNHTDAFAILYLSVSIPPKQIAIVNQLRNDSDSEIAAEATKLGRIFTNFEKPPKKGKNTNLH